ncbi:MAG: hypothetical protein IKJ43_02770 [Bacilli bacterium]|nr:hypothetical protein [Bacilli bacterium]
MIQNDKHSLKEKIFGFIFIFWFIASIVGIFVVSSLHNIPLLIFIFGQYFYVFGLISIYNTGIGGPFVHFLVGYSLMVGIVISNKYDFLVSQFSDFSFRLCLPYILILVLSIISFILLIIFNFKLNKKIYYWLFLGANLLSAIILFILCL